MGYLESPTSRALVSGNAAVVYLVIPGECVCVLASKTCVFVSMAYFKQIRNRNRSLSPSPRNVSQNLLRGEAQKGSEQLFGG